MTTRLSALQVRHFLLVHTLAETRHLSQASARLGISQPAASRRLSEIEALLGEPLFERHPKGMVTTPIGDLMARHAARVLRDLGAVAAEVEAFQQGRAGSVRIGAVTGPAVGYAVPAIRRLKQEAPLAEVSLDVAPSDDLIGGLLKGDYDMILSRIPPEVDARLLDVRRGRVEEVRFLTRAGHPLLARRDLDLADLAAASWVIQAPGAPIRHGVEQAFIERGLAVPGDVLNTSSLLVMLGYLRDTDAIAAITREVEELLLATGPDGWGILAMRDTIVLPPYHVIRPRDRRASPLAGRLLDLLLRQMAV